MLRKTMMAAAAFVLLALPIAAQTVDEILTNYVKASGGMEKIKAVNTRRSSGKLFVQGLEVAVNQDEKRSNMVRQESSLQGMTQIIAYDGKTGWKIDPFQGKKTPE